MSRKHFRAVATAIGQMDAPLSSKIQLAHTLGFEFKTINRAFSMTMFIDAVEKAHATAYGDFDKGRG